MCVFFFHFFSFQAAVLTKKKSSFSCSDGPISERVTFWTYLCVSRNSSFPKRIPLCHAKGYNSFHPVSAAPVLAGRRKTLLSPPNTRCLCCDPQGSFSCTAQCLLTHIRTEESSLVWEKTQDLTQQLRF